MSRLDAVPGNEREELKEEIKSELRHEAFRRKMFGCGACAVMWLFVIGLPVFFLARTLSKTGFFDVPVLGTRYYKPSAPVREVLPLAGSTKDTILASLRAKIKFDPRLGTAKIPFTEAELTTLVRDTVAEAAANDGLAFAVEKAQVAIEPDLVEIFAVLPRDARDTTVRLRFTPLASKGKFEIEIREVVLGDYVVPQALAKTVVNTLAQGLVSAISEGAEGLGTLNAITLAPKRMEIVIIPTAR